MYTYDVQYGDFNWDQKKEMGFVDTAGAINAFRSFPFREEYEKALALSEGGATPTISFRSQSDGATFAVWLSEPDVYEIFLELSDGTVILPTNDEPFIIESITSFFSGNRDNLFNKLANNPKAVTKPGLWKRIKSLFSS